MRGAFLSPPHKTNWRQQPPIAGDTLLKYDYSWEKIWGKVWRIQFLLLPLWAILPRIYILRIEIEKKNNLHITSYGGKYI